METVVLNMLHMRLKSIMVFNFVVNPGTVSNEQRERVRQMMIEKNNILGEVF